MRELKTLEKLYSSGKITRREFITRLSALGLAAAVAPTLLVGNSHAAVPKKGGRFRLGLGQGATTDSLDPGKLPSTAPQMVHLQVRNCLVELDHKYNPIPELAESWESSPDATRWTFTLRKGVEFHNGKSLEAKDVIYSINYHRGDESKSSGKALVTSVKDIRADGKYTVIFTLDGGTADFPIIMSDYHLAIFPEGTRDFEQGMGTGPFQLVEWEPGVRALTRRNPNYWKAGRGHFDEVETIYISDVNARTNALKTGQIDAMNGCERKTFHLLEKMKDLKTINATGTTHYTIPMLCDVAPFDNNDVRLGLKYAVDRKQLVKQVLRGYGAVGNDHPIAPSQRYFATDLPQRGYDPDKAKFHIKKAGMLDHVFELHVSDAAFAGAVDSAVLIKESAAKAGIQVEVVREPEDGYWSDVWMKKPWCFSFWGGRPSEDWMFTMGYAADAAWNEGHYRGKRFNDLLVAARAELDDKKRREMYVEMQTIMNQEGGSIIPMFANLLMATSNKIGYENLAANFDLDGLRAPERWYFV